MKILTTSAVEWAMDLLIHTNGQTTTLEVKNALREIGYRADQADVSRMMNDLYNEGNDGDSPIYECNSNGSYKIYSFTDVITDAVPNAEDFVDEDEDEEYEIDSDDSVQDFDYSKYNMNNPIVTSGVGNNTAIINNVIANIKASREPQYIFYTEKHARNSKLDDKTWIVTNAVGSGNGEIHAYDASLTRDQVRSRYASILKIKIQDVRAKRLANY